MVQARMPRARSAGRGKFHSRVAVTAIAVAVALLSSVFAVSRLPASALVVVESRKPRVLLLGDSVMDQQGSAAEFALNRAGVETKTVGLWGSSLFTRDQYDYGKSKPNGGWLKEAATQVAAFAPDVIAVYLNHNYWPPYPRDAAGKVIGGGGTDALWSRSGQAMIHTQVTALMTILRAHGARVYFVSPIPAGRNQNQNPDPNVWSPIWHGYLPVLTKMHVPIIDSSTPVQAATGLRAESKPSCSGAQVRVRPENDLHLTRFGAGLAGNALAKSLAKIVGVKLNGNGAPGDSTAALVPTADGRGYWLVGCEGSVFNFGTAARLPGARGRDRGSPRGGHRGRDTRRQGHVARRRRRHDRVRRQRGADEAPREAGVGDRGRHRHARRQGHRGDDHRGIGSHGGHRPLPRQPRGPPPQLRRRRHRVDARREGLLARRRRRRRLRLRQRALLRLDRWDEARAPDRGHGGVARQPRLLAGRLRRHHLRLRRRQESRQRAVGQTQARCPVRRRHARTGGRRGRGPRGEAGVLGRGCHRPRRQRRRRGGHEGDSGLALFTQ